MEGLPNLHSLEELIRWGGYAVMAAIVFAETGLLVGVFLPGDSLLVTAGVLASTDGVLEIKALIALLAAAAIAGDSVGYAIGHKIGPRLFSRQDSRFFHRDHLKRAERFYGKYGVKTIVLARFVPIVRTFAPTIAGVGRMRYRTFLLFNVLGGTGWVCSMTLTGYFLGRSIPDVEKHLHWVIAAVIVVSLLPLAHEFLQRRGGKGHQPKETEGA